MWCRELAECGVANSRNVVSRTRDLHHRIGATAVPEPGSARQAIADHRAIIRAIRTGDIAVAKRRMAQHHARNFEPPRAIAARHPEYFVPRRAGRDSSAHGALEHAD
jgi:DNA-binding GntR family transcriptional regulator